MIRHTPQEILDQTKAAHDIYQKTETSDIDDMFLALYEAVRMLAENNLYDSKHSTTDRWMLSDGSNIIERLETLTRIPSVMVRSGIQTLLRQMRDE